MQLPDDGYPGISALGSIPGFKTLDEASRTLIAALATTWLNSSDRPRVQPEVLDHWDRLITAWVESPEMPLLIRKSSRAGEIVSHSSGRSLLFVDNSPAHWCLSCALMGGRPTLEQIQLDLERGAFPVAMVPKNVTRYRGTQSRMNMPNLNKLGWKVCHVGMNDRTSASQLPMRSLIAHVQRLLTPRNMFVVPLIYSGLGEVPDFISAFQAASSEAR
jgi:hypothetical protein